MLKVYKYLPSGQVTPKFAPDNIPIGASRLGQLQEAFKVKGLRWLKSSLDGEAKQSFSRRATEKF